MKVLAIGTSNSKQSINRALAVYAASLVKDAEVEVLDINDFEMPLFSPEREQKFGQPLQARRFFEKVGDADVLVLAFAEHNGTYTAAWKNLFDWTSRIDTRVFQGKPAVYLSTSPGARGAASVLAAAVESAPIFDAELVGSLSLPRFHENFDSKKGRLTNSGLDRELRRTMANLQQAVRLPIPA